MYRFGFLPDTRSLRRFDNAVWSGVDGRNEILITTTTKRAKMEGGQDARMYTIGVDGKAVPRHLSPQFTCGVSDGLRRKGNAG